MEHKTEVSGYEGRMSELATEIGNLRYDALQRFLSFLSAKLHVDGSTDEGRGRAKLAKELHSASIKTMEASLHISQAWEISAPHMESP